MKVSVLLLLILLIGGCDTVESQYPTLHEARNDRLFERGWLPDILPASAKNIKTINNLDENTSKGEFFFAPDEFQELRRQLKSGVDVGDYERSAKGYVIYDFSRDQSQWRFSCNATQGHCSYEMHPIVRAVNR